MIRPLSNSCIVILSGWDSPSCSFLLGKTRRGAHSISQFPFALASSFSCLDFSILFFETMLVLGRIDDGLCIACLFFCPAIWPSCGGIWQGAESAFREFYNYTVNSYDFVGWGLDVSPQLTETTVATGPGPRFLVAYVYTSVFKNLKYYLRCRNRIIERENNLKRLGSTGQRPKVRRSMAADAFFLVAEDRDSSFTLAQ